MLRPIGHVRLLGELLDRPEAMVPPVRDFRQRAGGFGKPFFVHLIRTSALRVPSIRPTRSRSTRCLEIA